MRLFSSESDPELHTTPCAPRVRDTLSHLSVQSRLEHSGGNVWTLGSHSRKNCCDRAHAASRIRSPANRGLDEHRGAGYLNGAM
jgi:hypothetical protein